MAKKRGQLSIKFDDERVPKLFGMLCLFLSFYLSIAFISYLFTWEHDQDIVFRFSWEMFFSDVVVDNWLGRLGAFLADAFIYWGFGVASFGIVYLLYKYGLALMRGVPLSALAPTVQSTTVWMVTISVISAFFFQTSRFPFGGEFGKSVGLWIQNFVGIPGTLILLAFAFLCVFVWNNNPNLSDFSWRGFGLAIRTAWADLLNGNYARRRRVVPPTSNKRPAKEGVVTEEDGQIQPVSPIFADNPLDHLEGELVEAAEEIAVDTPAKGDQLKFDLTQRSALFSPPPSIEKKPRTALDPEDAELEISVTTPSLPVAPDDANQYKPPTDIIQESNPNLTEPYDPTLELSRYEHPHLQLLADYDNSTLEIDREELEANKKQIIETLLYFKIEIEKIRATIGPTVTLYEIVPARGVRISKIKNLEDDIALNLSALGIRIIAPIPGKGTIGIEVPNKKRQIVGMKETLQDDRFRRAKMDLPIALGKNIQNEVFVADLAKMPHLLIAGATGQGKSVGINVILMSLLYKKHPSQVKIIMIDPKKVELFPYARLENHFLGFLPDQTEPIVTDTTKVVHTLNSLIIEMETRYDLLKKAETRNIGEYNDKFVARRLNPNKGHYFMPFIVLVIDEFADLIMTAGKEIELPIGRLAQLARAVGIHLIIATQRPSVNIITGVIKANFPARIAFKVASKIDSRTILDAGGAEQLTGRGDMLLSVGGDIIRLQSAFVDTPEVERVIDFISKQQGFPEPFFLPEFHTEGDSGGGSSKQFSLSELDDLFDDAARLVVETQHGSTSMIQRRMKLGYNRAGRIMDQLEALGIVGPGEGSKPREVLYFDVQELNRYLTELRNRR